MWTAGSESIDEGLFLRIHGIDQWITIRGQDRTNPLLVIVTGPGVAMSVMAPFFAPWEQDFTIVQWDQPGAGATQAKNGDERTGALSFDRLARDGLAVFESLREGLRAKKVIVLALSGGTIVGLKMIKLRPDLFSAYVGSGQVVNWSRQMTSSYARVLERARMTNDVKAVAELEAIGPPPYRDAATDAVESKYASALTAAEQAAVAALAPSVMAAVRSPRADARHAAKDLPRLDNRTQSMVTYTKLRDELVAFDARALGLSFEVPMFFLQGEQDAYTVTSEVEAYAADIQAPRKELVLIGGAGHSPFFLGNEFLRLLTKYVRPVAMTRACS
jgi:pimeloyl-ACP methyl ester carboxylesterase